jgi:hypothetical protein
LFSRTEKKKDEMRIAVKGETFGGESNEGIAKFGKKD